MMQRIAADNDASHSEEDSYDMRIQSHSQSLLDSQIEIPSHSQNYPPASPPPPPHTLHKPTKKVTKSVKKRWVWSDDHVVALLNSLKDYKTSCDYRGVEFEADKPHLIETMRISLAKLFPPSEFGPEVAEESDHAARGLISRGKT